MIVIACQAGGLSFPYEEPLNSIRWRDDVGFELTEADRARMALIDVEEYELDMCLERGALVYFANEHDATLWRMANP